MLKPKLTICFSEGCERPRHKSSNRCQTCRKAINAKYWLEIGRDAAEKKTRERDERISQRAPVTSTEEIEADAAARAEMAITQKQNPMMPDDFVHKYPALTFDQMYQARLERIERSGRSLNDGDAMAIRKAVADEWTNKYGTK